MLLLCALSVTAVAESSDLLPAPLDLRLNNMPSPALSPDPQSCRLSFRLLLLLGG